MRNVWRMGLAGAATLALVTGGCPTVAPPENGDSTPVFNNTTDRTNNNASYIRSDACAACHPEVAAVARLHGHAQALKPIQGRAPEYPAEGTRAGVPNPPAGFDWDGISYVISGYLHGAFFVDKSGYVLTTGVDGVDTQWNLDFPPNGTEAGFVTYLPDQQEPKPYDYETCFRCHTTGPEPLDPENPRNQDNRPGILGTWVEAGVRCEVCHGPGGNHAPNPGARDLYVNSSAALCGECHTRGDDPNVIRVENGFINANTQYPQLLASGGHREFACTICHDPHASVTYDRARGIRNGCTDCHGDVNLAFHDGAVFELGAYTENVTCESCHMPLVALSNSRASAALVGPEPRIGDVRGHIFRINTEVTDFSELLSADGTQVVKDGQGRASVSVDFVCLRCHNEGGNVFPLTADGATRIAENMHTKAGVSP